MANANGAPSEPLAAASWEQPVPEEPNTQPTDTNTPSIHANCHIPKFLALKSSTCSVIQVVEQGKELTADNLYNGRLSLSNPILIQDTPTSIGMTVPKGRNGRPFSVRDVANVIGPAHPINVIDVRHQEELEGWTLGDLVEYFEDEHRLQYRTSAEQEEPLVVAPNRRRRAAAEHALQKQQEQLMPKVLNQISLEFSRTPLHRMVKSPQFVRDMDWIDHAWPTSRRQVGDYPVVQYYCLTSTAGCYTDFHVDFGGTAVWYHVLDGEKSFCLIPPTREILATYEDWLCRSNQAELFLPDFIDSSKVFKVTLKASQTMIIPTGWIHAVHTPVDSVVIGGNFLHGLDIPLLLEIHYMETRTRVRDRFRFPHFLPLMFYAGGMYLTKMRRNAVCKREVEGVEKLIEALEGWWKLQADKTLVTAANYAAHSNDCTSVKDFLACLTRERERLMNGDDDTVLQPSMVETKPKLRLKLPSQEDAAASSPSARLKLSPQQQDSKTSSLRVKLSPQTQTTTRTTMSPTTVDSSPRIKLSPKPAVGSSPRIKLSPKPAAAAAATDSEFRIVLPSNSHYALPKKRKVSRKEDLDAYIPTTTHEGDDEWQPKKGKRTSKAGPANRGSFAGGKPPQSRAVKKPKGTVRQRLMKRFR